MAKIDHFLEKVDFLPVHEKRFNSRQRPDIKLKFEIQPPRMISKKVTRGIFEFFWNCGETRDFLKKRWNFGIFYENARFSEI